MTTIPKCAIIADRISAVERERIQGIVKANANGWWHMFADLWIVGGRSPSEWRDLVGVAIATGGPGGVIVLAIDTDHPTTWASKAAFNEASANWLRTDLHP